MTQTDPIKTAEAVLADPDTALIRQIVERFLSWKLPDDFAPDGGISYSPTFNTGTPYEGKNYPSGTNLLSYTQAEAMVRHILADVDLLEKVEEWDGPLTEAEQAKIDAAWKRHKAATPTLIQSAPEDVEELAKEHEEAVNLVLPHRRDLHVRTAVHLRAQAAQIAGQNDALRWIAEAHIPDQPASDPGDELTWVKKWVATIRRKALVALGDAS